MTDLQLPVGRVSPRDILNILFRHGTAMFVCYGVIVVVVSAYCFFWPPSYEASVRYFLKNDRLEPLLTAEQEGIRTVSRSDVTEADLNSEMAIMQSAAVLEQVVRELQLETLPEHWAIRLLNWPLERANELYNDYHGRPGESAVGKATARLARRLVVEPQKKSSVVLVRLRWGHPRAAEQILEAHGRHYLSQHQAIRRAPDAQAFFKEQLDQKRSELESIDAAIAAIRPGATSASLRTERDLAAQQAMQFEAEWRKARALQAETDARVKGVQEQLTPLPERVVTQERTIISAEALESLKMRVLDLGLRRTQLLQKFQSGHREVQQVEEQLRQAEEMLAREEKHAYTEQTQGRNEIADTLGQDLLLNRAQLTALDALQGATAREGQAFKAQVAKLDLEAERLRELERERTATEAAYLDYARRLEEARVNSEMHRTRFVNVAPLEPVRAGSSPVKPNIGLLMKLALGLGLLVAVALAFVLDFMDHRIKTDRELEAVAGVPVLTVFERYDTRRKHTRGLAPAVGGRHQC